MHFDDQSILYTQASTKQILKVFTNLILTDQASKIPEINEPSINIRQATNLMLKIVTERSNNFLKSEKETF
jgi:hypothetical protein